MTISKELAQALLNYLATKPFQEVYILIQELQKTSLEADKPKE